MWDNKTEIKFNIFEGYGSKIQKVIRCRLAVSNETFIWKGQ